ncbi:MAG: hypothetical protein A2V66_14250 [Ignavibacteria bacterium RBG_13_36_8]|nr:MAG: hypothetical protein A2V66_14250 [Ignavibacteria bacterium RBG_13_36_8]
MLAKRKKLSRKQIKEDKLVTTYYKVLKLYEKYQSKILMILGAAAVVVVVIVLYSSKVSEDNRIATTQLSRIMNTYNTGSYQEAIDGVPGTNVVGLRKIVEDYSSTQQGEYAKIFLANCYYFLGNYRTALEYYDDYSGSNTLYKATAFAGCANCYEAMNEIEKAAELYQRAASLSESDPNNPEYLIKAGKNYIKMGQTEEAKLLLEKIKKDYKNSSFSQEADRYLAEVQ